MSRIETIAIGDELLSGRISDTNSTYIANQLFSLGYRLQRTTVIPDDFSIIEETLLAASRRADHVICFGGLGPTSDDKTAEAVARLLGCDLVVHEESKLRLETYYRARNRIVTPQAMKQVLYPRSAKPLSNSAGMAPGIECRLASAAFYFLPGVPREMKTIFSEHILRPFAEKSGGIHTKTWRCIGIWESDLQREMDSIESDLPRGAWLGYRTRFPENHLTLYIQRELGEASFESWSQKIREKLKPWSYTEEEKELEELISERLLAVRGSIALAESCTGGLTAQRLSRINGASDWLWGATTVYQNDAKRDLLGVELAAPTDSVSQRCTQSLATSVKRVSGCVISGAITGYLGPTGGTEMDPVGTIYLAVEKGEAPQRWEKRLVLPVRPREEAQWGASTYLLHMIYEAIR